MTARPELFAVLMERGHLPDQVPPQLEVFRAMLANGPARFAASVSNADGSLAMSCIANSLEIALAPCAALETLLEAKARWTSWLGPGGQAEIARMRGTLQ